MEISVERFVSWMDKQSKNLLIENKEMVESSEQTKTEDYSSSFKDNRAPKCARCRNHGMVNSLKGHKHFCQWKNCNCSRCQVVVERQRITASRVATLRQQRKLNETGLKRSGLKFHDNLSSTDRQLINLDSVKYLNQMKKYRSFDSDNESDHTDSSGPPATLSPPASPPSSITSCDYDNKAKAQGSYCSDPSCYECWKISQYLLKTNINKLVSAFPMAPTKTLEAALLAAKGNYIEAEKTLRFTLRNPPTLFRGARPCTDPDCKECGTSSDLYRRSPITIRKSLSPINRKRTYPDIESPIREYSLKRPFNGSPFLRRDAEDEKIDVKSPGQLTTFLPPVLIKYCVDCNSRISADDKFCGKCGLKQPSRIQTPDS